MRNSTGQASLVDAVPLWTAYACLPLRKLDNHFMLCVLMFSLLILCMVSIMDTMSKVLVVCIVASSVLVRSSLRVCVVSVY